LKKKVQPKNAGEIHITIVGDQHTSKTTLLKNFAKDGNEYTGLFEYCAFPIKVGNSNDKKILKLFDTDSDELYARIRAITYKTTDLFLLCFSLTDQNSFFNVQSWYAEVNQLSP